MKLLDVLSLNLKEWPKGAYSLGQAVGGQLHANDKEGFLLFYTEESYPTPPGKPFYTGEVTKEQWENAMCNTKFNLEESLEDILGGQPAVLSNGLNAKVIQDLRDAKNEYDYPLIGYVIFHNQVFTLCWDLNGKCKQGDCYGIVSLKISIDYPENMWDIIDPKWKYVAVDEDGESWFFTHKPIKVSDGSVGGYWEADDTAYEGESSQNHIIPITSADWSNSLSARPCPF